MKDYEYIQENHDEEQQHEHHEAHRARGLRQPQQPTPQQIPEHNLAHLPHRNWCPICVQGKGRQDNYKKQQSRQPVIQVDFAYIKSQQDPKTIPVLTAVDVTTQLCRAVMVPDKPSMMDYMVNNLQAFVFECGRTQGILQSDNEDTLHAFLQATAAEVGSMTVRHAPSYSSNSQGSVERLHRTLLGQARVVKAQVESNYSMTMSTKHCLLPWMVRHAAWTVNRYVIHSNGYTSFERRWGRNYERAICKFSETTTLPSTTTQETSKGRPTDAEMHLARKSFRNRRKLRRNGIRRTKGTNSMEATTGLWAKFPGHHGHHNGTPTTRRSKHCWTRNYNRQRKEDPRKISDNGRTRLTTSLRNPRQNNNALHHLHNFRLHRRQVHDHYRIVLWLLHQPDDNIHHYQHHLDKH